MQDSWRGSEDKPLREFISFGDVMDYVWCPLFFQERLDFSTRSARLLDVVEVGSLFHGLSTPEEEIYSGRVEGPQDLPTMVEKIKTFQMVEEELSWTKGYRIEVQSPVLKVWGYVDSLIFDRKMGNWTAEFHKPFGYVTPPFTARALLSLICFKEMGIDVRRAQVVAPKETRVFRLDNRDEINWIFNVLASVWEMVLRGYARSGEVGERWCVRCPFPDCERQKYVHDAVGWVSLDV